MDGSDGWLDVVGKRAKVIYEDTVNKAIVGRITDYKDGFIEIRGDKGGTILINIRKVISIAILEG